jgi:DNA polymerase III delta prime subunit
MSNMSTNHHALLLFAEDVLKVDVSLVVSGTEVTASSFEKFGVSDAQQLVKNAHIRPAHSAEQTCVVRAQFITLEAQNALLKVFEEPPVSTKFLLVVPKDFIVLPTLLSRCEIIHSTEESAPHVSFEDFCSATLAQRLVLIESAQKKKDTQWQRSIKSGLIKYLETHTEQLKELEYVTRMLLTRGASNKMLLEHAALLLPIRSTV